MPTIISHPLVASLKTWTPITVSPIGAGFFSARGVETLISELKWVWLPCVLLALMRKTLLSRAT